MVQGLRLCLRRAWCRGSCRRLGASSSWVVRRTERGQDRAGRLRAVLLLGPVACWLVVVDFYRRGHHAVGFISYSKVVALWVGALVITGACGYLAIRGGRGGRRGDVSGDQAAPAEPPGDASTN